MRGALHWICGITTSLGYSDPLPLCALLTDCRAILSPRLYDICLLLIQGYTQRDIAERLHVHESCISVQRQQIRTLLTQAGYRGLL